jgi:hypothetical protein
MASAFVLGIGTGPAMAQVVNTPFGTCVGDATHDCVTATGHADVSVVTTLTINEQRAISFGNISVACTVACDGKATLALALNGTRTAATTGADVITPLRGAQANNNAGGSPGNAQSGGQQPGHYTIETDAEGSTKQIYISFADTGGNPIDISGDSYHPGAKVTLTGPAAQTFTMDKFLINESGSDVYGHYIDNRGGANNPSPGISNPFDHTHTANTADVDVVVGATLHTVAIAATTSYAPGKYTGTFNIMASY